MYGLFKIRDIPKVKDILGISKAELVFFGKTLQQRNGKEKVIIGIPLTIQIVSIQDSMFFDITCKVGDEGFINGILTSADSVDGNIRLRLFTMQGGINQQGRFRMATIDYNSLQLTKERANTYRFFHDYSTSPDSRALRRLIQWKTWKAGYNARGIHECDQKDIKYLLDTFGS